MGLNPTASLVVVRKEEVAAEVLARLGFIDSLRVGALLMREIRRVRW